MHLLLVVNTLATRVVNSLDTIIAYQNKKHTFNWLNTLHVTFTIPHTNWDADIERSKNSV
jgi:hypothetical protein